MTGMRGLAGKLLQTAAGATRPLSFTSPRVSRIGGASGAFFSLALAAFLGAEPTGQTAFEAPLAAFAQKAAAAGMAQVELLRVGAIRAASVEVRRFSARMVEDQSRAGARLRDAAAADGIRLPTGPDLAHSKILDSLRSANGTALDVRLMDQVVTDLEATIADFEKAAETDGECPVRAFARGRLPELRAQLETARRVRGTLRPH